MLLGGLFEVSWGAFLAPRSWRSLGEAPRVPREALEAFWRPLGGVLELFKMLGRLRGGFQGLPGAYGALLEASWGALRGVLERSWTVLEGPWTPKGRPKEAQEAPKWRYRGLLNRTSPI